MLVLSFYAIYNGTALDCQLSPVISHCFMCPDLTCFHRKLNFNQIPPGPCPFNVYITIFGFPGHLLSIHGNRVLSFSVYKGVEIGGNGSILSPPRYTEFQCEFCVYRRIYDKFDFAFPGMFGHLFKNNFSCRCLYFCSPLNVEVHINVFSLHGIHITGNRSHKAGNIPRAAGTPEPGLTQVLPHGFQRVVIEKTVSHQ